MWKKTTWEASTLICSKRVVMRTVLLLAMTVCLGIPSLVAGAAVPGSAVNLTNADPDRPFTIVVTAGRLPQAVEEIPASVYVLERDEIVDSGARHLADALRLVPGASVVSYGSPGAAQQVSLRGSTSQQVLVLVDGLPVAAPQGAFDMAHIPVTMIDRIEVVSSPASALYGADAVGGVINVITTSAGSSRESQISVRSGAGEVGVVATNSGVMDRTYYTLTGGHSQSDGHRPNSDHQERHIRLRLDQELSPISEGSLQITLLNAESGVPGSTLFPLVDARQRDLQLRSELSYLRDLSMGQLQADVYLRRHVREYADSFSASRHQTVTLGGEVQRDLTLRAGTLSWGLAARTDRVTSTDLDGGVRSAASGALFAQLLHDFDDRLSLMTGLRADVHSAYPAPVSPSIGLRAELTDATVIRLSTGRSFRAPTFDDLYWFGSGNPNLEPEIGWNTEAGVRHDFGWTSADLAVFHRYTENLIQWAPGAGGVWRPDNIAASRTRGLTVKLVAPLSEGWEASVGVTRLDARDAQSGDLLAFIPPIEANGGLHYSHGPLRAHVSVHHRGARPTSSGGEMPPYTLLNGQMSRPLGTGWELAVQGENLLDVEFSEAEGYPMPGRRVWIGLSYQF